MAFALNDSGQVNALRANDGVRVDAPLGPNGFEIVELDLSQRASETHCLVAFPSMPNEFAGTGTTPRIHFSVRYEAPDRTDDDRTSFVLYVATYRNGKQIGQEPLRFLAGGEDARIVLDAPIGDDAERYQLVVYADRQLRGALRLRDFHLTAGMTAYRIGAAGHLISDADLGRTWRQDGRRVVCTSPYGEHWAEMPNGWRLDEVHPAALAAADWILFGKPDQLAYGVTTPAPDPDDGARRYIGSTTLLSFSLGTDSTAAMTLLPDDTIRYYCRRPYTSYLKAAGARIPLPDPTPWEQRLERIDNLIVVPNTFEMIGVGAGARHGYTHNFGYAAIGLLLADHVDAGTLAFGSVLEQAFLRSGHLFADVVALPSSAFNSLRKLINSAGLFLSLPTAGCSEVLTSRISEAGRFAGLAISCPRAAPDGTPCGTCFKCFRKLRLDGRTDAPEPDDSVVHLLEKYPLKSATSVMYAVQRATYRHPSLDPYLDVDLALLERYFDYAVEHMVPDHLQAHVRGEFAGLGIQPMTDDEELRLRTIGQVFWPESFSWSRAGIAEPTAEAL